MAWIKLPADDETPALKRATSDWNRRGQTLPNVVAVLKPNPAAMRGVMMMNRGVTFGGSELGHRREELIATTVSTLEGCFY